MKTGIVILNYNDAENTIKMLQQIKDYACLSKIVVVDNHSTDDSVSKIKPYEKEKIVLIEAKENRGYGEGNNLGLKYLEKNTNCSFAIISNPDILVEESVMEELIKDMRYNSEISFLAPKIIQNGRIEKGWKLPTFLTEVIANINVFYRIGRKLQSYPAKYYQERLTQVDVIAGCFFLARLKDFKKIHYFDPNTFLYYEENIIAKKAKDKELFTMVDTSLSVEHLGSKSVDKSLKKIKKYKILKQSQKYFLETYYEYGQIKMGIIRFFYYISLGIAYLTFWI